MMPTCAGRLRWVRPPTRFSPERGSLVSWSQRPAVGVASWSWRRLPFPCMSKTEWPPIDRDREPHKPHQLPQAQAIALASERAPRQ
jgi:hypothetical protein